MNTHPSLLALLLAISGCAGEPDSARSAERGGDAADHGAHPAESASNAAAVPALPAVADTPPPVTGGADPAAAHCVKLGGEIVVREDAEGQYGMCRLPDGRVCEEWGLFNDNKCRSCSQLGGKWKATGKSGFAESGMCHLPDGRVCNETQLLRDGVCADTAGR